MKSPNHDTSPITEEDLAPAEGTPVLVADPARPGTERQVVSFWHTKLDENQPPDFVGTLEEVEEFRRSTAHLRQVVIFDTSDLTRNPSTPSAPPPTYKDRQRELDRKLQPRVVGGLRRTSRAERRKAGDYRTAREIIADDMAAGRVK